LAIGCLKWAQSSHSVVKNAKLIPAHSAHVIISPSFLEAEQLVDEQGAARGKSLKEKMLVAWSDDGQALLQLLSSPTPKAAVSRQWYVVIVGECPAIWFSNLRTQHQIART